MDKNWCSSPYVLPFNESGNGVTPNKGYVYTVEWNSADTNIPMDATDNTWPAENA